MNKVGMDISQEWIDACIRVGDKIFRIHFSNDGKGRNQFHKWLKKYGVTSPELFMEATGRYGEDLAMWAHGLRWKVTIVNPRAIRGFAGSRLQYNKTDKLDAECILRFAEGARDGELREWHPRSPLERELREYHTVIAGLAKEIGQQQCRLKSGIKAAALKETIKETIQFLKKQMAQLEAQALKLIKSDPKLAKRFKILLSIKGIGNKTARVLLSKIDFDSFKKGRELVGYAGLGIKKNDSGKKVGKGYISRVGHSDLRSSMYMPALTAMTHDPEMIALKQHLEARRKYKKQIICAVMAALLRKAFALVRDSKKIEQTLAVAA